MKFWLQDISHTPFYAVRFGGGGGGKNVAAGYDGGVRRRRATLSDAVYLRDNTIIKDTAKLCVVKSTR